MNSRLLGQQLTLLMKKNRISQAEVARRVGMQPSHLNRFIRGRGDMHAHRLLAILAELGVDLNSVLESAIEGEITRSGGNELRAQLGPTELTAVQSLIRMMENHSQSKGA